MTFATLRVAPFPVHAWPRDAPAHGAAFFFLLQALTLKKNFVGGTGKRKKPKRNQKAVQEEQLEPQPAVQGNLVVCNCASS